MAHNTRAPGVGGAGSGEVTLSHQKLTLGSLTQRDAMTTLGKAPMVTLCRQVVTVSIGPDLTRCHDMVT